MKPFKHTRRSSILFFLLTPFTLFIYPIVVLSHVGKDLNRLGEKKEGYVPCNAFFPMLLLGIITLGIVPLVWTLRAVNRVKAFQADYGLTKPKVSAGSFFCWMLFGSLILVGPFIAMHKFLHGLNLVERKYNELLAVQTPEEVPAIEAPAPEALPASEEPKQVEMKKEEEPAPAIEKQEEAKPTPTPIQVVPAPKPEAKEEKKPEVSGPIITAALLRKYAPCKPGPYRVRFASDPEAVLTFEKKEEAIAFASELAALNGGRVIKK